MSEILQFFFFLLKEWKSEEVYFYILHVKIYLWLREIAGWYKMIFL